MVAGPALKITVGLIATVLFAAAAAQASSVLAPLALAIFIIAIVWPLQHRLQILSLHVLKIINMQVTATVVSQAIDLGDKTRRAIEIG